MNRWLLRPRVLGGIAAAVFLCMRLFQLPASPAASAHFVELTGAAPFDERPAGYTLSGVLAAFRQLGTQGLFDYECYREHPQVRVSDVPVAASVAGQAVSLPVHPGLSSEDLRQAGPRRIAFTRRTSASVRPPTRCGT